MRSIPLVSPRQSSPESSKGILPFYLIEAIAVCSDLVLIVMASVVTGLAYHYLVLNSFGPVESFLAQGALACIIFSSILAALGAYRPQILVDFWKQMRLTTVIWLFVFFVLSAVAFSFKISETFSRGAILTFFVVGWAWIISWRFILAGRITLALAKGRFAKKKIFDRRTRAANKITDCRGPQALRLLAGANVRVCARFDCIGMRFILALQFDGRDHQHHSRGEN